MPVDLSDAHLIRITLMLAAAAIAVVFDVRERRIPNALTLPLAAAGLGIGALSGGERGLIVAVAGLLVGGLLFLLPVAKLGWGMGDLKLVAALGAVAGPLFVLWMGLYAMAAGGLFALLWLRQGGQLTQVASGMRGDLRAGQAPRARSGLSIPFAVPIAAGMLVALLVSPGLPR
ncbi:MAG: A24 family peptidase [Chloroflexota bacterium]|nr:A24 family peptidase [Chloroflexota bacterium]